MQPSSISTWRLPVFALIAVLTVAGGIAYAQSAGCRAPERPSVGIAVGRSSPYVDLARGAVEEVPSASILVRSGRQVSARLDLSIAGPLRLRVEGATARWNVVRQTYSPDRPYEFGARSDVGHIGARHVVAAIGLRGGRRSACGHVLAGGGLYSLTFRDATLRRPGVSIMAGIEVPTGPRGRVQIDLQLHVIDTNGRYPVGSTTALGGALVAGWAYVL